MSAKVYRLRPRSTDALSYAQQCALLASATGAAAGAHSVACAKCRGGSRSLTGSAVLHAERTGTLARRSAAQSTHASTPYLHTATAFTCKTPLVIGVYASQEEN